MHIPLQRPFVIYLLKGVTDRIFSTSVELTYTYALPALSFSAIEKLEALDIEAKFNQVAASAKETTLEVFATDESASVQVRSSFAKTLYPSHEAIRLTISIPFQYCLYAHVVHRQRFTKWRWKSSERIPALAP